MWNRGEISGPVSSLNFQRLHLFRPTRTHLIRIRLDIGVASNLQAIQRLARALVRHALGKVLVEVLLVDLIKVRGLVRAARPRRINILFSSLNQIIVATLQVLSNVWPYRRHLLIAMVVRVCSAGACTRWQVFQPRRLVWVRTTGHKLRTALVGHKDSIYGLRGGCGG